MVACPGDAGRAFSALLFVVVVFLWGTGVGPGAPPAGAAAQPAVHEQDGQQLGHNWPSFRGTAARGIGDGGDLPMSWDVAAGDNVRWSTPIPGYSHSSPIVWGERVFVVTAISEDPDADGRRADVGNIGIEDLAPREWRILALDRASGEIEWQRNAHQGAPRVRRHEKGSHANSTPVTDGEHVVAVFNSEGIFCWSFDGELLWSHDLGLLDPGYWGMPDRPWGHASSPIIHDDLVIVQSDDFAGSFLVAFRLADGAETWRVPRDELATWSTPTLFGDGDEVALITQGGNHLRAYDPRTGEELWRFADHAEVKVPTPFATGGMIIATGGAPAGRPIFALEAVPSARPGGDAPPLRWQVRAGGPYTSTPLAYDSMLYVTRDAGILSAYDLGDGELLYRQRLEGAFSASPVAGDDKLYLSSEDGEMFVVAPGPEFELLAVNDMGESIFATPAISGDLLIVRTRGHLYGIGAPTTS